MATHAQDWAGKEAGTAPRLRVVEDGGAELPASPEAEEAVLGCCLAVTGGADALARCLQERVTESAFYSPVNAMLWRTMVGLRKRQTEVTIESLAEELRREGALEAVGGLAQLLRLTGGGISPTLHLGFFLGRLKELWVRREMLGHVALVTERLRGFAGTLEELPDVLEPLGARVYAAAEFARGGAESMQERAARGYERTLRKLAGEQDTSRQLMTGLAEFDSRFGAFDVLEEEWLIGVAALPSVGKSALVRKWVDRFLLDGKRGLAFPLETGLAKWLELSAATACRINARSLATLPKDLAERYRAALELRRGWIGERLWIYDDPIRAETLCARVEDHVRQHGPVDFVVVDHLHELYSVENKFRGQREQELGYIAKELKKTAKRLNTPFFVPTQLNRAPTKDGANRRPTMQDIRGSGEIEAAYDRLVILHVPKEDMRGAEQSENQARIMMELVQAKSRNGPKGHREFWFDRPFTDFVEIKDQEFEHKLNTPGGAASTGGYKR